MWYRVRLPGQVASFLEQGDDLGIEVDVEFKNTTCRPHTDDLKKVSRNGDFAPSDVVEPGFINSSSVKLLLE